MEILIAQGRMGSQRHHEIQLLRIAQHIHQQTEQKRQRQRARVIRDQNQQALVRELTLQHAKRIAYIVIRKKRPEWGILQARNTGTNQRGEVVFSFLATAFVPRRNTG